MDLKFNQRGKSNNSVFVKKKTTQIKLFQICQKKKKKPMYSKISIISINTVTI